jgi:hypothetical protein
MFFLINIFVGLFILSDIILEKFKIDGRYYFNHSIANMMVVLYSYKCMIDSYSEPLSLDLDTTANITIAKSFVYSIHFYHTIWYYKQFRFDDWVHHLLMVGVALPLTELLDNYNSIGHCLFFVNGLPGAIDYMMLFLVRNNIMCKMKEKYINRCINLWIRCPGCISNTTICLTALLKNNNIMSIYQVIGTIIIIFTIYWNGIYFMNQVIVNYTIETFKNTKKIEKITI